jgi:recombination associated protein RdgC
MWFKNLQVYRLPSSFEISPEDLTEHLKPDQFTPCGSQELSRAGWVPPLGDNAEMLLHSSNGYWMFCSRRQDRLLPASVIKEVHDERVQDKEQAEDRKLSGKERRDLKEEIQFELLPRAFVKSSRQFGYISAKDRMLVIDSRSATNAEAFVSQIRESVGSFPAIPLTSSSSPIDVMTSWLVGGQLPSGFELGEECEIRDNADIKSIIRFKNQNLRSDELISMLNNGMHVSKLALIWQERVECIIDENLGISRLRFSDVVLTKSDEVEAETVEEQFDVDFSIMTLELSTFMASLLNAFGGEKNASDKIDGEQND